MSSTSPNSMLTARYAAATNAPQWTAPAGIKSHGHTELRPDLDFFAEPPAEIGELRSATTSLRLDKHPMSLPTWLFLNVGIGSLILVAFWYGPESLWPNERDIAIPLRLVGSVIACFWALIVAFATRFRHECSFVGSNGFAVYRLKGSRHNPKQGQVITFSQLAGVTSSQTRHYHNGIYTGTFFDYKWLSHEGTRLYRIKGSYYSSKGTPKARSPFHLAVAAETAWTLWFVQQWDTILAQQGAIQFDLSPGKWVRVGKGFVEFHMTRSGQSTRVEHADIGNMSLNNGWFSIKHKDARWFSGQGKFSMAYGQLINARAFLIALQAVLPAR